MSTAADKPDDCGRITFVSGENLPPPLQRIAEEELGETSQVREDALASLNQQLDEEPDLHSRRDNGFLLRFLRVRKYNVAIALKKIKEYYKTRQECPSVFENFVPSQCKLAARHLVMELPQRDSNGRPVVLFKPGAWNPSVVSCSEVIQVFTVVMEYMNSDPVVQTLGVSFIVDYEGFTLDKIFAMNIGLSKRMLRLTLDCAPIRVKAINVVREPYAFDVFYAIVRTVLGKKIKDRIYFRGVDFEGLHEDIPVDMLPKEFGGLGPDVDCDAYWSGIDQAEDAFVENNRYGYRKNDRISMEVAAF